MKSAAVHVIVMAGGSGTRFWPRSRKAKPKQLLALWDDRSLLSHTLSRCMQVRGVERFWIVTAEHLVEASKAALLSDQRERVTFLGEPVARNTAPCILWALREVSAVDPNAIAVVVPADSYIRDEKTFSKAIETAVQAAISNQALVTLGVEPTKPETGYGYIKSGNKLADGMTHTVDRFVEKPDLKTAEAYLKDGSYLWNAGMFVFPAAVGLRAFEKMMPSLWSIFASAANGKDAYANIGKSDATSFDYGIMERAASQQFKVCVVPVSCGWNDVGSFAALEDIDKSVLGDVVALESSGNVVQTDRGVVALLGVQDLIVVRDGDVVLVTPKSKSQDIKKLLEETKKKFPKVE